ncbi:MAG: polysaccharide deacetylase [Candidatus Omnitrophica bacterium CG11_big_fil_rev_8_21_14_0_20_41_12]|nr:MAG: polysaccharide deacetylase [Candidatus Omnitrophica bacterium CG11_big_fil_rev_8_21_14_0_20_41_12]
MKIFRRIIIIPIVAFVGFYFFWVSPRYAVPILTYHGFNYEEGMMFVRPEIFEKQMRYLKDKGCNVISLNELVEGIKIGRKFAHNTVVITIDDGYKNNFTRAYPVLKRYGFPATVFLITNDVGTKKDFLTWDEIKEMAKNNISFGGHTKNHVYLPEVNKEDILWDEIYGPKKIIEDNIGMAADYFCYPKGGFTEKAEMLVKRAGYKGACTTNRGKHILNPMNVYELRRISIRDDDPYFSFSNIIDPISFRAKLSGYYNILRSEKEGY